MKILGIDPGPLQSAYVFLSDGKIIEKGHRHNWELRRMLKQLNTGTETQFWCESIESYGMAVGRTVFETCYEIGRFMECIDHGAFHLIGRREIKIHLCNSMRAKDTNIRQALIDRWGEPGTKKSPGVTHGISKHLWSALAVATYGLDHGEKSGD